MDTEFVRTFLKIVDTGSFISAAKSLHLTQAAVSRRIRSLEEYMGCELFVRNRSGASLTASGRRFLQYGVNIVQTLEHARYEVGIAPSFNGSLVVGGRFGLWQGLLIDWLDILSTQLPQSQIRALTGFEDGLMQSLVDGSMDIGIMYTPQHRPTLQVERLLEEELILVTTEKLAGNPPNPANYVHVDWGPEFRSQLNVNLPELSSPRVTVGISWLGLQRILQSGGSGYFPRRLVTELIQNKQLYSVEAAPSFKLPVYVVYPNHQENPLISSAIALLHQTTESILNDTENQTA
ncbi:LysR family transcriptional regulator [Methylophaga nitratireducenticrescens]|uniref:LysR family transcriptional regulator n=1 Tax=Methylophaga nitratireducenticrescens TaxID=754476 RepID=UPI000CDBBCB8|nr:LysR family transcriptional regulator [Methylophaga nitratireducenticrescens]AUZ85236.1 LysR family transcriptional regulator [Methylophaga nitratireducenticrescens]